MLLNAQDCDKDVHFGDVRVDQETGQASLVLKKDLDEAQGKRWIMKLQVADE